MPTTADVLVIGLGAMGAATFHALAKRGVRVIGLEQFSVAHDRGSSHGETRIIRKAYFEHPDYVPLLHEAYRLWNDLERAAGLRLYHETGLVVAGPAEGEAVPGARLAARLHNVRLDEVDPVAARQRFPWLSLPDDLACVFEPEAGFLEVERCVAAMIHEGQRLGGHAVTDERVTGWNANGKTVLVETERGRYEAASLVIAAGPWSGPLLAGLGIPLEVVRKPVAWFGQNAPDLPNAGFFVETGGRAYYGIPSLDGSTTKVAEHSGGEPVVDPLSLDRSLRESDLTSLQSFLDNMLSGLDRRPRRHSVCMYTLTPDRHFVIDRHPHFPNVAFACGFSGHGFKFAPVVGEALTDLACHGQSPLPVGFLSFRRFAP